VKTGRVFSCLLSTNTFPGCFFHGTNRGRRPYETNVLQKAALLACGVVPSTGGRLEDVNPRMIALKDWTPNSTGENLCTMPLGFSEQDGSIFIENSRFDNVLTLAN